MRIELLWLIVAIVVAALLGSLFLGIPFDWNGWLEGLASQASQQDAPPAQQPVQTEAQQPSTGIGVAEASGSYEWPIHCEPYGCRGTRVTAGSLVPGGTLVLDTNDSASFYATQQRAAKRGLAITYVQKANGQPATLGQVIAEVESVQELSAVDAITDPAGNTLWLRSRGKVDPPADPPQVHLICMSCDEIVEVAVGDEVPGGSFVWDRNTGGTFYPESQEAVRVGRLYEYRTNTGDPVTQELLEAEVTENQPELQTLYDTDGNVIWER